MLNQQDKKEIAQLEQLNARLTQSLERCRFLLADCRSKLAANANSPDLLDMPEQDAETRPG